MQGLEKFLADERYVRIELECLPSGHQVVTALVNGAPGVFVLDSGASKTVVAEEAAKEFGLPMADIAGRAIGVGTSDAQVCRVPIDGFRIGGVETELREAHVMDLGHVAAALRGAAGRQVHGVVGQDLLRAHEAILDFGCDRLFLRPRPTRNV